ncbi:hypothetical protein BDC45DRAFT_610688 [Circinella umbellata]|nr:hypothetical protein BDC45DRAFT_610688 [Circinella umbellata]
MDLGSLLNQDTSSLSIESLRELLKESESSVKLNRLTNATFTLPSTLEQSFEFFNVHIQLLLSIQYTDDEAYGSQYANTILVESLRTCTQGLIRMHYGQQWLFQFSCHFTFTIWQWLHTSTDKTILMYLYGLSLSVLINHYNNNNDHIKLQESGALGLVQFIKSRSIPLGCHIWLMCCTMDNKNTTINTKILFFNELEIILEKDKQRMAGYITDFLLTLDNAQVDLLSIEVDQRLENTMMGGLVRPIFSKDDLLLGHASFLASAQNLSRHDYPEITRITRIIELQRRIKSSNFKNPLYTTICSRKLPSDMISKVKLLRTGIKSWQQIFLQQQQQNHDNTNEEFNIYLRDLIYRHYPIDQKTMLDVILAFWTIRDPYNQHRTVIINALLTQLKEKKPYNRRSSPYYAFTQLFNTPVLNTNNGITELSTHHTNNNNSNISNKDLFNNTSATTTKTGADIDISQLVSEYSHSTLKKGCLETLKLLTAYAETSTKGWVADCLQEAMPQVVEAYIKYLATLVTKENNSNRQQRQRQSSNNNTNGKHLCQVLRNPRIISLGSHVVPTLLLALDQDTFMWLQCNSIEFINLVQHYFNECSQLTKQLFVINLLETKTKIYMDQLLSMLRDKSTTMNAANSSQHTTTRWFLNHFIRPLLTVAGNGTEGVATQIFRQILKTRADFIWYLGSPSLPLSSSKDTTEDTMHTMGVHSSQQQQYEGDINFKGLEIAKTHEILAIKQIGLVDMFHEMVRLGDTTKTERLVQMWYNLWTSENNSSFTVPVSWIMQCIGLYDEAPAVVKQMIEQLIRIGIQQSIQLKTKQEQGDHSENNTIPNLLSSSSSRSFIVDIMDLMILADIPELDSIMDVFFRLYQEEEGIDDKKEGIVDDEFIWCIVETLIQLIEELRLETAFITTTTTTKQRFISKQQKMYPKPQKEMRKQILRRKQQELENRFFKGGNRKRTKKNKRQLNQLKKQLYQQIMAQEESSPSPSPSFYFDDSMDIDGQDIRQQHNPTNKIKALYQLISRALTFLLTMGSYDDSIEEIRVKVRLRNKLSEWLLLYEPLGILKKFLNQQLQEEEEQDENNNSINDLFDDLNSTIDVYIQNLIRCNQSDLVEKAQRLLDCNINL